MKTSFTLLTVLAMAVMLVGGCVPTAAPDSTKGPASPTGTIEVRVTDAPARYDIVSVNVTVSEDPEEGGVWVHKAVAEQEQEEQQGENNQIQQQNEVQQMGDGWIEIDMVEGKNPFNLKELEGGLQEVLATASVPTGNYTQIRMNIEKVVVTYTYEVDGSTVSKTVEATLPSGKLKFVRHFEVIDGETMVLLFDFIAEKSVVFTGATQSDEPKVIFKPVIKLSIEQGGKTNEIVSVEGTISGVDTEAETISIIPNGETQAIVLNVTPQTEITLDGDPATLADLNGLGDGNSVTASYYLKNFKAIQIDAQSPPE